MRIDRIEAMVAIYRSNKKLECEKWSTYYV
jgi:hypothetical protein